MHSVVEWHCFVPGCSAWLTCSLVLEQSGPVRWAALAVTLLFACAALDHVTVLLSCRVIPQEQVQHNPFTLMAATRRGGHLAFLQVRSSTLCSCVFTACSCAFMACWCSPQLHAAPWASQVSADGAQHAVLTHHHGQVFCILAGQARMWVLKC